MKASYRPQPIYDDSKASDLREKKTPIKMKGRNVHPQEICEEGQLKYRFNKRNEANEATHFEPHKAFSCANHR